MACWNADKKIWENYEYNFDMPKPKDVCDHKWRTGWAYAMVCELPDCPESNPPTMSLRLEWCERCGILRMPENRRKMGREVME